MWRGAAHALGKPAAPLPSPKPISAWKGRFIMPVVLDWTRTAGAGEPVPCVICGKPAICRSPAGKPVHKVCAETWTEQRSADRKAVA
ncbi:hypothetical protein GA0070615_4283 [Micromonospora aurantiaca]|nr:hypothetical protein GA0070615_4283 [Micromonospora aurantiaca]